jgi:hypothetical protein
MGRLWLAFFTILPRESFSECFVKRKLVEYGVEIGLFELDDSRVIAGRDVID